MAECRVVIEFRENLESPARMRWEHTAEAKGVETFALLGQAFDISRRECTGDFHEALAAFFRGAMIQKEDVVEMLARLDDTGQVKSA